MFVFCNKPSCTRIVSFVVTKKPPLLECALHISGRRESAASQCAHKKHAPNDVERNSSCDVAESVCNLKTAEHQFVDKQ